MEEDSSEGLSGTLRMFYRHNQGLQVWILGIGAPLDR